MELQNGYSVVCHCLQTYPPPWAGMLTAPNHEEPQGACCRSLGGGIRGPLNPAQWGWQQDPASSPHQGNVLHKCPRAKSSNKAQARNSALEGMVVPKPQCPTGRPSSDQRMMGDHRQNTHSSRLFIRRKRETPNGNRQTKHPEHKCTRDGKAQVKICSFVCGGPGRSTGIWEGLGE